MAGGEEDDVSSNDVITISNDVISINHDVIAVSNDVTKTKAFKNDVPVTRPNSVILVQPATADGDDVDDDNNAAVAVVVSGGYVLEEQCPEVARSRVRFETFRHVVEQDLATKLASLQGFRASADSLRDRNYANIQIFMLNKYAGRLRRFQVICDRQLAELTAKLEARAGQEEVQVLADRYVRRVAKLTRRMKHILDVSEKYAAMEIFESLCEILATESTREKKGGTLFSKRNFHSMDGINTSFTSDSEAGGLSNLSSSASSAASEPPPDPSPIVSSLPPSPRDSSPLPTAANAEDADEFPTYPTPPSSPELSDAAMTSSSKAKSAPADCRQAAASMAAVDSRKWRASSLQSLTDHLAVWGKTFTSRR